MAKGIVYVVIGTVGVLFGAVQPWITALYAGLMILGFVALLWQGGLGWRPGPWAWATVGIFLAVTLFQVIPLPRGFLGWVSPARARILEETAGILGLDPAGNSVAYSVPRAFARWGFVLSLALFFWVCARLGRDRRTFRTMVWVALAFGTFEALYGLAQVLIPRLGVLWVSPDFAYPGCSRGTYINRNHFAGLMEMIWPVALGATLARGAWEDRRGIKALLSDERVNAQLLCFLMVGLMVTTLLFSRSRAGILGGFVGMAALAGLLRTASPARAGFRWGFRITLVALAALVAVYGARIGYDRIVERFLQLESGAGGRMEIWEQSWAMVADHPAGVGLGNYEVVEPVYVDTGRAGVWLSHAHNDYLQLAAEAGWPGAVALAAGFFLFLGRAVGRVRRIGFEAGRFRLMTALGALAGLCSMAFHGFWIRRLRFSHALS